jgi:hypothetical protein
MTAATLRFSGVQAESSTVHRSDLTVWLSRQALTEWLGDPAEAFEIPTALLKGAQLVEHPRGAPGCIALIATLHGRYVRWVIPAPDAAAIGSIRQWVDALGGSR